MQQNLVIYTELMNGKYHSLRDTVLQNCVTTLLDLSSSMVMGPDFKRESFKSLSEILSFTTNIFFEENCNFILT